MYPGVDLHKRYAQVAVVDSEGQIIEEVRIKNVNLNDLARRYTDSHAVIETTSDYYHVYDTLAEYLDVTIAHPGKLTLIAHSDKKTDHVDAKELVRLLRLSSVPQSCALTDEIRQTRVLVRGRQTLVEDHTKFANKIHGLLVDNGIAHEVKPLSVKGREFPRELSLPSSRGALLELYLDVVGTLTEQMTQLGAAIGERAESLKETQLFMTIPGVSYYSALLIYAELREVNRSDNHKETVSYMGLSPTIRESGNSRIESGISRRDSGRVWQILVQSVHSTVYTCKDEYLNRFFHRLNHRMNPKEVIVTTTRELLVSMYYMPVREEAYDPPGVNA